MKRKTSEIQGFDYPDLDLSEDQSSKKQNNDDVPSGDPHKKNKIDESIQKNNQTQIKNNPSNNPKSGFTPNFKPNLPFFPPPPPGGMPNKAQTPWTPPATFQKPHYNNQNQNFQRPQYHHKNQYHQNNQNRDLNKQKKSIVYVKNIPKSFCTQDKMMTFFKNEGVIKQIKVNEMEQSAVIKFVKEQNAAKFLKSNKIIFNRSYIVYGETQDIHVSPQQITDRINDELGNVKKAQKTNLKVIKQKVSNQLAQNIRALYFLQNNLLQQDSEEIKNLKNEIQKQIISKVEAKKLLQNDQFQDFKPQSYNTADYNWSLTFVRKSPMITDKRGLFAQFLKYGPIISLDFQSISEQINKPKSNDQQNQEEKPLFDYKIKILFLGIKHAWSIYKSKKQEMAFSIQGKQIKKFFQSDKLKTVQPKKIRQTENIQSQMTEKQNQVKNLITELMEKKEGAEQEISVQMKEQKMGQE